MSDTPEGIDRARPPTPSGEQSYRDFIALAIAAGEVWTLKGPGGFVAYRGDDGEPCFPFWPHRQGALALATDDWADCAPEPLPLALFMQRWLPGMARDGRQVAIFPTPTGEGLIAAPDELLRDLTAARDGGGL